MEEVVAIQELWEPVLYYGIAKNVPLLRKRGQIYFFAKKYFLIGRKINLTFFSPHFMRTGPRLSHGGPPCLIPLLCPDWKNRFTQGGTGFHGAVTSSC